MTATILVSAKLITNGHRFFWEVKCPFCGKKHLHYAGGADVSYSERREYLREFPATCNSDLAYTLFQTKESMKRGFATSLRPPFPKRPGLSAKRRMALFELGLSHAENAIWGLLDLRATVDPEPIIEVLVHSLFCLRIIMQEAKGDFPLNRIHGPTVRKILSIVLASFDDRSLPNYISRDGVVLLPWPDDLTWTPDGDAERCLNEMDC